MCGLIAIIAKQRYGFYGVHRDIFSQMLYTNVLRGSDATGVFGVNKQGNLNILKQASPAGWFLGQKTFIDEFQDKIVPDYQIIVGHNRKATHGERKDVDAHPFYTEPVCLVHNGMITNHKELCKESTVDSNAVCNAFADGNFKEILRDIEGAYAFIWYNIKDKTLYFIRNDRRPLFVIETNNTYILASEAEMVEWICKRNNQTIKQITECAVGTLYSFNIDNLELKEEKLDLTKVSKPFRQQQISYLPTVRHKDRHPAINDTMVDQRTLLLTDIDFSFINNATDTDINFLMNRYDLIHFEVEDIEDYNSPRFSGHLVRVAGGILNCPKAPVTVIGFVPMNDIKDITENYIVTGTVNRIEKTNKGWNVWVTSCSPSFPAVKSSNDYWITNDMWMSENFDCHCATCNKHVTFEELDQWEVFLDTDDTIIKCPDCIKKGQPKCINE